ncbi:MAG TPA: hypothetical protein EYH17_04165 [Pyrodictium sp.]|nr:hypothetical protein [Pyrodictium sp.]
MQRCVRCGREVDTLVDGRVCVNCYLELYGFGSVPQSLRIVVCPRCSSYLYQGRWMPSAGDISEAARLMLMARFKPTEHVDYYSVDSVEIVSDPYKGTFLLAHVRGKFKGIEGEYERDYLIPVFVEKKLCPLCFQRAAGTFNAIIQLRGYDGRLSEEQREALERLLESLPEDVKEAIVEIEEVREGIDLKLSDQGIARALAAKIRAIFGAKIMESFKLVGRRSDGKRLGRLTISVRLPFFHPGSLACYRGAPIVIEEICKGYVYYRRLGSTRKHRISVDDAWKLIKPLRFDEIHTVEIVVETPSEIHIQLLDKDYEYLELSKRHVVVEGTIRLGAKAILATYKGKTYLLGYEYADAILES